LAPAEEAVVLELRRKLSYRLAAHLKLAPLAARGCGPLLSFTFDDAPASAATEGAAILEQHGLRGTFYLNGGLLGARGDAAPLMPHAQAKELAGAGHEIGCHTYAHADVRVQDWHALEMDLAANDKALGELTGGAPLRSFAYPFGGVSFGKKLRLQSLFQTCRGVLPGVNAGRIDRGFLRAVPLYSTELDLAEAARWIAETVRLRGWLIFFTHDVADRPTRYGVTPRLLASVVRSALAAGCTCLPVAEAFERIHDDATRPAPRAH
jgi:peptidoglycan/xylan/chitin deacetylase (PgdA/CDA1 family)